GFMRDPERITIAISKPSANVKQGAFVLHPDQKLPVLVDFLKADIRKDASIIIFCSRKQSVSALYQKLKSSGFKVGRISSDLEQEERESVMQQFRNRSLPVLVATDVISRGIDIDGIDLVINFDIPRDAEDYVHRIGRTARAQRSGEALTLVSPEEFKGFQRIERLIQQTVEKYPVDARFGPTPNWGDAPASRPKSSSGKKPFFKRKPKPKG
ncbi:MAG: helicase-related protein, partial [Flavobacteriales bacterium]